MAAMLLPATAIASGPDISDEYGYEYPGARAAWEAAHNASVTLPPEYDKLWDLPEEELRQRIEEMRITPETREWPVHESPVIMTAPESFDRTENYEFSHPIDWWISAIDPVNNETGNYSEIGMIPEIGSGDIIHLWGIPGHTYEGGFTIPAENVTIRRWEGSPVPPLLTSPSNITPAITVTGDNTTLSGLNISNTHVIEGNGAGISVTGIKQKPLERLTIEGCIISGNKVKGKYGVAGYGGGIYAAYVSDIRMTDCTLSHNFAESEGGGVFIQENSITIQRCTFNSNSASIHGGGAYFDASDSFITDSTFSGNTIMVGDGGGMVFRDGSVALTNTTISGNNGGRGGGAYFEHLDPEITDCNFIDNSLNYQGSGDGGGAYFSMCNATLTDTRIAYNEAPFMFCGGGSFHGGNITLINSSFISNTGGYEGGATFYSSTVLMEKTEISENIADFYGGGMNIHNADIMMKNCAVERNGASYGGGIYSLGSEITLINSSLSGNIGIEWGGGAGLLGSGLIMRNTTVSGNEGARGGGIFCDGAEIIAENSLFSDNIGTLGGAIGCKVGGASISNTTLINNGFPGDTAVNAIEGGIFIHDSEIIGKYEYIASAAGSLDVTNVTFDALEGNTTTISCTGWNIGIGTATVPPSGPDGNKTIRHAMALTGINYSFNGGFFDNNSHCDLKMQHHDSDLGPVDESQLMLFQTNGTYWEQIPNSSTNTTHNYLSVVLTEKNLPETVVENSAYYTEYHWNWTTLVPAGPTASTEETISLPLSTGWNMVSSPFETITTVTIPDEVLVMYGYDPENMTYVLADLSTPCPCNGYWIGTTAPCTVNITGIPLTCYQKNLSLGWNMIGCQCDPIPIAHISTTPETQLSLYRYDPASGHYQTIASTGELLPGEGYWAGVACNCVLKEN